MNIRERADLYMEKHFPESDFEDLKITTDQLVDGIPQAYEDGYKDAINEAVKWLQNELFEDVAYPNPYYYSDIKSKTYDFLDNFIVEFRKAMEE